MNDSTIISIVTELERQVVPLSHHLKEIDRSGTLKYPEDVDGVEVSTSPGALVKVRQVPIISSGINYSALSSDIGSGYFFERIWVTPVDFNFGFITENGDYEIKIWNASRYNSASITSIIASEETGVSLTYPSLPDTIGVFADTVYTLSVLKDGPPLQDTTYTITIGGIDYTIDIDGIRVVPWYWDINWDSNFKIAYRFSTTIWNNGRYSEQRRPLSDESWVYLSFSVDSSAGSARKIFNLVGYIKDKVVGIPIFNEKLTPISVSQGSSIITVSEDFTYCYNLQNRCDYIIIVDHENGLAEIKAVSSLGGTDTINLSQSISEAFDEATTNIYPCLFCFLQAYSGQSITDDFEESTIEFKEYKSGA